LVLNFLEVRRRELLYVVTYNNFVSFFLNF